MVFIDDLEIGYTVPLTKKINFAMASGDYVCVIGENGAGKSTLIKTILGLQEPISGTVIVRGYVGYLPQQTDIQRDFPASVWEIVLSGRNSLRYSKEDKEIAEQNMELLGITELKDRCFNTLSGGQQQKTLLARAMCAINDTGLLVLDEPVNGLDIQSTKEMYETIQKINQKGISILMISHDNTALEYASHILTLTKESVTFERTHNAKRNSNK